MSLGHCHRDGGGHGFGQQGDGHILIQPKQTAHHQDAPHGGDNAYRAAHQYRQPVLFQKVDLGVNGHRQTRRGRSQEHIDDAAALVVILIGDVKHRQNGDQQRHGDDHIVADDKSCLFLDLDAHPVYQHRQGDAEGRGCIQLAHFAASFPFPSSFRVRCTAAAVAP